MIVTVLKLANVRAVEAAEFSFKPGFNLIIGVNGVGKTTALESLAVSLGAISRHINGLRGPLQGFIGSDLREHRFAHCRVRSYRCRQVLLLRHPPTTRGRCRASR